MYNVYFTETSNLPRLSYGAFAYTGIYAFNIPSNVSTISQDVFIGCPNLYSITFSKNSLLFHKNYLNNHVSLEFLFHYLRL